LIPELVVDAPGASEFWLEGRELDLVLAGEQDDLDQEERARLHAALDLARQQAR